MVPRLKICLNHLLRRQDILLSLKTHDREILALEEITKVINIIRFCIVDEIRDEWNAVDYHMRFLRRVDSVDRRPRDIFTINYDTVIEASLKKLRMPYTDGFVGAEKAYFDSKVFVREHQEARFFRLFKMHGSINWIRDEDGFVRRKPAASIKENNDPIVVYPSEQKYLQTQFGVYETLMNMFRNRLRVRSINNNLMCIGYSFNDEHINEAIIDAVQQEGNNLSIYAFIGPDAYDDEDAVTNHKLRLTSIETRCRGRINFYVGNRFYVGDALDRDPSEEILKLNLWRFENLVGYLAGD